MPDGTKQSPGGWNRIVLYVDNRDRSIAALEKSRVHFRNVVECGPAAGARVADQEVTVDLGFTVSGPDRAALARELVAPPAFRSPPDGLTINYEDAPVTADWLSRCSNTERKAMVWWGEQDTGHSISFEPDAPLSVWLRQYRLGERTAMELATALPAAHIISFASLYKEWAKRSYHALVLGGQHAPLGWACALRGERVRAAQCHPRRAPSPLDRIARDRAHHRSDAGAPPRCAAVARIGDRESHSRRVAIVTRRCHGECATGSSTSTRSIESTARRRTSSAAATVASSEATATVTSGVYVPSIQ